MTKSKQSEKKYYCIFLYVYKLVYDFKENYLNVKNNIRVNKIVGGHSVNMKIRFDYI